MLNDTVMKYLKQEKENMNSSSIQSVELKSKFTLQQKQFEEACNELIGFL